MSTWYEVEMQIAQGEWTPVAVTGGPRDGRVRKWNDGDQARMYAMQHSSLAYPMRAVKKTLTSEVMAPVTVVTT